MNAKTCADLIEEMIELKVQQHTESHLKANPELARILEQKRETDRRRLEQIRLELVRVLG
jgi:predicted transposase YbfD/YdcC